MAEYSEGLEYTLSDDGSYYIVSGIGSCVDTIVIIPERYGELNLPVKKIAQQAFTKTKGAERIVNIIIPDSVQIIEKGAFQECTQLTNITIPFVGNILGGESNTYFEYIFEAEGSRPQNSCLPATLKIVNIERNDDIKIQINLKAFAQCATLQSINMDDSVIKIEESAFIGCKGLTKMVIPNSVKEIGKAAFQNCENLQSIEIPFIGEKRDESGNLYFGYIFGKNYSGSSISLPILLNEVIIQEGIETINEDAFKDCENLKVITIPNGVTRIDQKAFSGCTNLTEIVIPNSVTSIGDWAFDGCSSLTKIVIPDGVTSIGGGAFKDCSSLTEIVIPDSVTSIGESAFMYCSSLTSVTIGNGVISIGDDAFNECSNLNSIIMEDTNNQMMRIGAHVFENTKYYNTANNWNNGILRIASYFLISADSEQIGIKYAIPTAVRVIADAAFEGCDKLKQVTTKSGSDLRSIGKEAFSNCGSLETIKFQKKIRYIGQDAFYDTAYYDNEDNWSNNVLYIGQYLICGDSSQITGQYTIKSNTLVIANAAFEGCDELTGVTIPKTVVSIGENAFEGCESLINISIPSSVTSIGDYAFSLCEGLTEIVIPDSVTSIGSFAFAGCYSLTKIILSNNITNIGNQMFSSCISLTEIVIPNSVTSIEEEAFWGCEGLIEIVIPDSVASIGDYAFLGCSSLIKIIIPDSVTSIGAGALSGCSSLIEINLPYIGNRQTNKYFGYIFGATSPYENSDYVPSSLSTIIITGDSQVYENAFYECKDIKKIILSDSITAIEAFAFDACQNLIELLISSQTMSIGDKAFYGCDKLQYYEYENGKYLGNDNNPYHVLVQTVSKDIASCKIHANARLIMANAFLDCENLNNIIFEELNGWVAHTEQEFLYFSKSDITQAFETAQLILKYNDYMWIRAGAGLEYTLTDNSYYIVKSVGDCTDNEIIIPATYENLPLKKIQQDAFKNCQTLTKIIIPGSIIDIGTQAFYGCSNLIKVTFKDSELQKEIQASAFYNCKNLIEIRIPGSFIKIGKSLFKGCEKLKKIEIPFTGLSLTTTDPNEFYFGYIFGTTSDVIPPVPRSLKRVRITKQTIINNSTFKACSDIEQIILPNSVTSIGNRAFSGCYGLTEMVIPNNVTSIGESAFFNCEKLQNIIIPKQVKTIGESAFSQCRGLKEILFEKESELKEIANSAFYRCDQVSNIEIPRGVEKIGDGAFESWDALTSITIPFVGSAFDNPTSGNRWFGYIFNSGADHSSLDMPPKLSTVIIDGKNPSSIDNEAFLNCRTLTSIKISSSIISIGLAAFKGCSKLQEIVLPFVGKNQEDTNHFGWIFNTRSNATLQQFADSVPSTLRMVTIQNDVNTNMNISSQAFRYCKNLTNITLLESVQTIGDYAFADCSKLSQLYIGKSINNIGKGICQNDTSLTDIAVDKNNEKYLSKDGHLYNKDQTELIQYAVGSTNSSFEVSNTIEKICNTALASSKYLTSITLPESLIEIGENAFQDCVALIKVKYLGTLLQWCTIDFANAYSNPISVVGAQENDGTALYVKGSTKPVTLIDLGEKRPGTIIASYSLPRGTTPTIAPYAFANYKKIDTNKIILPDGAIIADNAFFGVKTTVKNIYCEGPSVTIGDTGNDYLDSATKYYYAETKDQVVNASLKYWKYSNAKGIQISNGANGMFINTPYFKVDSKGRLQATDVDISGTIHATDGEFTGKITATSGVIGGCEIDSSGTLKIKNANISGKISADHIETVKVTVSKAEIQSAVIDGIEAGEITFDNATGENVNLTGEIHATSGQIGALIICDDDYGGIGLNGQVISARLCQDGAKFAVTDTSYAISFDTQNINWGEFRGSYESRIFFEEEKSVLRETWKTESAIIVTSDANKKHEIQLQPQVYSQIFDRFEPVIYKYNNGRSDRIHTGLIAQAVEQAVLEAGLTTQDFAAVCYDIDEETGEKKNYGIRYEELVSMCIYEIQKLKKQVKELESQNNNLTTE